MTRDGSFEELLDHLKHARGFDFTGYKRASLTRRIDKRMQGVGASDYDAYRRHLEEHPDEFGQLFNTILINVTSFFRDEGSWQYLREHVVPRIVREKGPEEPIRVWSAGCATGEEAYSLAMTFAEALPEGQRDRLKIYATDVDEEALAVARLGVYGEKAVQAVPPELLEKYFDRVGERHVFRKELRRLVIFGRNDLIQDAPISRIDLLVCRNTLMYFDAATQAKILSRFHFALNDEGCLFLGRAETLLSHMSTFAPVDIKSRLFMKVPRTTFRERLMVASRMASDDSAVTREAARIRDAAIEASLVAQVVVDRAGVLALANARARAAFRLSAADVGRPLQDLELSYRPVELRSRIEQVHGERRAVVVEGVEWRTNGDVCWFDVHLAPVGGEGGEPLGVSVSFVDVTATKRLHDELEQSHQELEAAYEELQSTNEELETTNEELQSTVEELETTNEELQSTNEELETMNEELQSTNEELQTMNDELRRRGNDLNELNDFLESVFTSVRAGVAVLDGELRVLVWNSRAEDLWGVRSSEAEGVHFLGLDIGLPVEQVKTQLRACLQGEAEEFDVTLPATNRRGRGISCRVTGTPLIGRDGEGPNGVIVFMEARAD